MLSPFSIKVNKFLFVLEDLIGDIGIKRNISDSVLQQKPLYNQKKSENKDATKISIPQRLRPK